MYLKTGSTCPVTADEWRKAAGSLQITAAPSGFVYKPISMFPPLLATEVMSVPLNISALQLNMTLSSRGPAPAAKGSPFRMAVNANVTHGFVFSDSPMTGGAQLQALSANNSISTSRALLNLTRPAAQRQGAGPAHGSAQQLNIVLPEFKLTFNSKTSGMVGSRPWSGSLTFSLAGGYALHQGRWDGVRWPVGLCKGRGWFTGSSRGTGRQHDTAQRGEASHGSGEKIVQAVAWVVHSEEGIGNRGRGSPGCSNYLWQ
jgi:hypothetical protein